MTRELFVAICLIGVLGCAGKPEGEANSALDQSESAIINGRDCAAGECPSTVAILVDADLQSWLGNQKIKTYLCTGTLIAPDVVLAAAHCFDGAALTGGMGSATRMDFAISFQSSLDQLASMATDQFPTDAIQGAYAVKHPRFSMENFNGFKGGLSTMWDIGLLFLSHPVQKIQPAVVITGEEAAQIKAGNKIKISGWGYQQAMSNPYQQPPAGSYGLKRCAEAEVNEVGLSEMQIGSDEKSARKCHGDSGGPTYLNIATPFKDHERVIGITSHAYDNTDCQKGGIDTRIDAYLDWIDANLTAGCAQGKRSWCDVPGIIPAAHYEPAPAQPLQ